MTLQGLSEHTGAAHISLRAEVEEESLLAASNCLQNLLTRLKDLTDLASVSFSFQLFATM